MKHSPRFGAARFRRGMNKQWSHRQHAAARDQRFYIFSCSRKFEDFVIAQCAAEVRARNDSERAVLARREEMNGIKVAQYWQSPQRFLAIFSVHSLSD